MDHSKLIVQSDQMFTSVKEKEREKKSENKRESKKNKKKKKKQQEDKANIPGL